MNGLMRPMALMNCLPKKGVSFEAVTLRLESRMQEICQSGSVGGAAQLNVPFLPQSFFLPFPLPPFSSALPPPSVHLDARAIHVGGSRFVWCGTEAQRLRRFPVACIIPAHEAPHRLSRS